MTVDGIADSESGTREDDRLFTHGGSGCRRASQGAGPMTLEGCTTCARSTATRCSSNVDLTRWGEAPAPRASAILVGAEPARAVDVRDASSYSHSEAVRRHRPERRGHGPAPHRASRAGLRRRLRPSAIDLSSVEGRLTLRQQTGSRRNSTGTSPTCPSAWTSRPTATARTHPSAPLSTPPRRSFSRGVPLSCPSRRRTCDSSSSASHRPRRRSTGPSRSPAKPRADPSTVEGAFSLRDGFVRYEGFPYPISGVTAHLEFDNDSVTIGSISGSGPTGAQLLADGAIAPLGEDAVLTLNANLFGLPIDDHFRAALPEGARDIVSQLLHRPTYDELVARGLIISSGTRDRLAQEQRGAQARPRPRRTRRRDRDGPDRKPEIDAELARIGERLDTPVFDLGGTVNSARSSSRRSATSPASRAKSTGGSFASALWRNRSRTRGTSRTPTSWSTTGPWRPEGEILGITGGRGTLSTIIPQIDRAKPKKKVDRRHRRRDGPRSTTSSSSHSPGPTSTSSACATRLIWTRATPAPWRASLGVTESTHRPLASSRQQRPTDDGHHGFDVTRVRRARHVAPARRDAPDHTRARVDIDITERRLELTLTEGDFDETAVNGNSL